MGMEFVKILLDEREIADCVNRLAGRMGAALGSGENVVAVVVLEGARRFADDLLERLGGGLEVCYVRAASYHGGLRSSGAVSLAGDVADAIAGRRALIIDDVYDTGRTLAAVVEHVRECGAAEVKVCVLLEKDREHEVEVEVDFVGAKVEDLFLVGYGLDYEGKYRDLPYVAVMEV